MHPTSGQAKTLQIGSLPRHKWRAEGGEGVANVNAPGVAGVPILRDLQLEINSAPGAHFQSPTPSLSPPPATDGGRGNLDYRLAGMDKGSEFEECSPLLHKARRCRSAPSPALRGGLEGGEGVAKVDAPGYAGVHILRDL